MTDPNENDLIACITAAFANVRLDDGISLNMTEYHDSGGSASRFAKKANNDERDDWRRIADKTLEHFTVTFSFTDLKGFRFYIPAYMIWTIRNHRTSESVISDFTIYAIDPDHYLFRDIPFTDWFTVPQVLAMVKFLEYCITHADSLDINIAETNLRKIRYRFGIK